MYAICSTPLQTCDFQMYFRRSIPFVKVELFPGGLIFSVRYHAHDWVQRTYFLLNYYKLTHSFMDIRLKFVDNLVELKYSNAEALKLDMTCIITRNQDVGSNSRFEEYYQRRECQKKSYTTQLSRKPCKYSVFISTFDRLQGFQFEIDDPPMAWRCWEC